MNAMKQLHLENCLMVDLVQQDKWWRLGDNTLTRRKDMKTVHKVNTLAWLVRNADKLIRADIDFAYSTGAPDDVIDEAEAQARWRLREPQLWMLNTPLARALLSDLCELAYPAPVDPPSVKRDSLNLFLPIAAEISEADAAYERLYGRKPGVPQ